MDNPCVLVGFGVSFTFLDLATLYLNLYYFIYFGIFVAFSAST